MNRRKTRLLRSFIKKPQRHLAPTTIPLTYQMIRETIADWFDPHLWSSSTYLKATIPVAKHETWLGAPMAIPLS